MNLKNDFLSLNNYFSTTIIGEVNDQYIKITKIKGEKVPWYNHEKEDELFFIVDGELLMEIENKPNIILKKGDLYIVKKSVNHSVSSPSYSKCSINSC
jgi:mannose-6-phosphate isomerase-like protein (cupin superfamily)